MLPRRPLTQQSTFHGQLCDRSWYQASRAGFCSPPLFWLRPACPELLPRVKRPSFPSSAACCLGHWQLAWLLGSSLHSISVDLAAVTSASRMAFAFARDGGLPWSCHVRWVCPRRRSPAVAIWAVAMASVLFTLYTPVYATITAVCTIFLYISYVLPTALGAWTYGRTWTVMGPWKLGLWYRPLAVLSVVGCAGLIMIGMQPPNQAVSLGCRRDNCWRCSQPGLAFARRHFRGPPHVLT